MAKTVLIVDDDPNVVDLLVNIVKMLGLEVQTAPNGREALNSIARSAPDAVILDLMMPVMDGFTMLMQLRKEEAGQKMPVIVLSALADQKGTMDRLPGITGTITKGRFSLLELRDMLGKAGVLEASAASAIISDAPAQPHSAPTDPHFKAPSVTNSGEAAASTNASPAVGEGEKSAPIPDEARPTPPLGIPRTNGHGSNGNTTNPAS